MPLQRREVALEDLAPATPVGESRLDPAQGLRDRVVLLLKAFESPVDLIEVPEHVVSQLGDLAVHLVEPAVDPGELPLQEFDELLVLGRGHGSCPSQVQVLFKCVPLWTGGLATCRCHRPHTRVVRRATCRSRRAPFSPRPGRGRG